MPIEHYKEKQIFHLKAKDTSYIFAVMPTGHLKHIYWGKKIRGNDVHISCESQKNLMP